MIIEVMFGIIIGILAAIMVMILCLFGAIK